MEGSPKLSRELCKKIFLKSLDDMESCYLKLLKYTRDPNFLEKYKFLDIELQDQLWVKHGVSQEEINYWVEHYNLMKDRECYRRDEEVNESDTAEKLTRAYMRASMTDNI